MTGRECTELIEKHLQANGGFEIEQDEVPDGNFRNGCSLIVRKVEAFALHI